MAVRTDEVQLRIDFITDDSKKLAGAVQESRELSNEIAKARKNINDYNVALKGANITEEKRAQLLGQIADREALINTNLRKIAETGKQVEKINLANVAPAQLVERARQLQGAMARIPQSAPEYARLRTELSGINAQLGEIRRNNSGAPSGGGGFFGTLLSGGLGRAIPVIGGIVTALQGLRGAVTGANDLEQLTVSFETFLGSAEKAKQVIGELKAFEVKTPFEADQVNQAGRALLAFGFSTSELIPTLTRVGDVASGTGKDFNELALIYGKARAQGLIQGEELNQLAEAGIPIYKELAKVLNVTEGDIRKLGEQGKIQFKDLEQVFKNLTGEGGRFNGLMEKQSQTLGGLYSTLQSAFKGLMTQLGTALAPAIKSVLGGLTDLVKLVEPVLVPAFKVFGASIQGLTFLFSDLISGGKKFIGLFTLENLQKGLSFFGSLGEKAAGLVGKYREARAEARKVDEQEAARERSESDRDDRQLSPEEKAAIVAEEKEKARVAAAERKKAAEAAQQEREAAQARRDAALKKQLAGADTAAKAEELIVEAQYIRKEISEQQYYERLSQVQEAALQRKIDIYRQFHEQESTDALEAQNELQRIEQARAERAKDTPIGALPTRTPGAVAQTDAGIGADLSVAQQGEDIQQAALKQKFKAALMIEDEYKLRSLELKKALIEEELAILRSATDPQVKEIEAREAAKAKVTLQIAEQREENERRLAETMQKVEEARMETFSAAIDLGITLLSKDQAARKRHAGIIKAFEIGQVVSQGVTEVQKIFAKNAGLPGGTLLSIAESIPAAIRTTASIVKIQRQQFAQGGDTGMGWGAPDSTGRRPVGVVHENEYVIPHWMRTMPEVRMAEGWMEGIRLRGYAQGGLATVNTTPNSNLLPSSGATSSTFAGNGRFEQAVEMFVRSVERMPTEVKARVAYTEIETAGSRLNTIRNEANI